MRQSVGANGWSRRGVLAAFASGAACAMATALLAARDAPGLLLRNVRLVDGSGGAPRPADVVVRGDRIAGIVDAGAGKARGLRVIEAGGRVLAPGFIDLHTHGDPLQESYASYLAMGVTTVLLGQDGGSPALAGAGEGAGSLPAWLDAVERAPLDLNVATLSGHGALRRRAGIDDGTRRPQDAQLRRMQQILARDLQAGAFGMSSGLEYVPGRYAETRELAGVGPVVARHDGVVMSHMRSEDVDDVRQSIRELVAASGPARAHVSHLKMVYGKGEAAAEGLLDFLRSLRGTGRSPTADAYPYEASYTGIGILFPEWALPPTDYAGVLSSRRDELHAHLQQRMDRRGGPEALLFGTGEHAGQTLAQVAARQQRPFAQVLLELGPEGGQAAHFVMDRALQDRLLLDPLVALGTDGSPGGSHPRSTGTFARWIEQFVVKQPRVSLEEAIRKVTSLPASILGIVDRGTIREGAVADLVLFDPARVRARSDYLHPTRQAEGFDLVVVNGQPAFEDGKPAARPGRLLRRG